jgi:PKD repeat protein
MNSVITSSTSMSYSVASLPSVFTDGGYEVTALWNTPSAPGVIRVSIGGQSFYLRDNTEMFEGSYAESVATNAAQAVAGNNYVKFSGLNSPSFDLIVDAVEGSIAGLSGMQIRAVEGSSSTPVNTPPVAQFTVNRDSGTGPLMVTFDASSSYDPNGTIFRYEWDLGDGSTATGPVVGHTYTTVDNFEVELRVIDNNGTTTSAFRSISVLSRQEDTGVVKINFQPLYVPVIDGYQPDYGAPFADRGNGFSYGWAISRQSATREFNSALSPDKRYDTAVDFNDFGQENSWSIHLPNGKYDVRLVMGGDPSTNSNNTVYLNNILLKDLDAFLSPDFDEYMVTIDLQDGNLDIKINNLTDRQFLNFIEVYPHVNRTPVASFTASPPFGVAPLSVDFDASSSVDDGAIASYIWDFGDGSDGNGVSPRHTFNVPGAYPVTLTVTDSFGLQNSLKKTVHVTNGSPVANLEATPIAGIPPLVVDFNAGASFDTDGGAIVSYAWNFGDGTSGSERTAQHTYAFEGVYTATLTVTDNDGHTAQTTQEIYVSEGSEFGISMSSQLGDAGDTESVRGTRILSDGSIVLAANIGSATPGGTSPAVMSETGASSASGGAIIHISADGKSVLSALRIADEVVDLSIDDNNQLYIAAGYDGLIQMPTPTTFGWQRLNGNYVHRVDAGGDGQSAALVPGNVSNRENNAGGGRIYHHAQDGTLLNDFSGTQNTLDIAIDTERQSIYLTGWRQLGGIWGPSDQCSGGTNTRFPVQIAYLRACAFNGSIKWHSYSWDRETTPGVDTNPCPFFDPAYPELSVEMLNPAWLNRYTNNMADTRGIRIILGDDGKLYAGFEAAGGNHIFRYDPYDLSRSVDIVGGDGWHSFTNTGSSHKTFVGKYDPETGNYLQGQQLNTIILNANGPGANGLGLKEGDLYADADGRLFVAGSAAAGLPFTGSALYERQPGQIELNPFPSEYYTGGAYLIVLSPDFETREFVTRLTGGITHSVDARKLPGKPYANIVFGGSDGNLSGSPESIIPFYAVNPMQPLRGGGAQDGFFVVLGGVGGQIPDIVLVSSERKGRAPLTVDFNATASSDIDGSIESYSWNFGDGTIASSSISSHTYSIPGTYDVTLIATDNDGFMAKETLQVTVYPSDGAPPVANAGIDIFFVVGPEGTADVTLDGSASYDPDGLIQTWRWMEGETVRVANDAQPHLTLSPGDYLFTLQVTDSDLPSNHTSEDSVRVKVYPQGTQLIQLNPQSDTYVRSLDFADLNYGGVSPIQLNGGTFNEPREVWLQFDLRALQGNIIDAGLQLIPVSVTSESATFNVHSVENDLWNEYSLKWNNRPAAGLQLDTILPVKGERTVVELNHTWFKAQQTTDGIASLRIASNGGINALASWHSKESTVPANRPVLVLAIQTGDGQLPVANFDATPTSGPHPLPVLFDAGGSVDNMGIVSYTWDFGDGSPTGSGATDQHTYSSAGDYTVTLTVTDSSGLFDTTTEIVSVNNGEPISALELTPINGLQTLANASGSFDVNGSLVSYAFNFGDGTTVTQTTATATHTYSAAGTYTASVIVTDNDGYTDTTYTQVTVNNGDPVALITADTISGEKPLVVQFDGSGSVDYDGTIVSYTWDMGDGSATKSGSTMTHTFTESGRFEVGLTVVDDDGRSDFVIQPIIVSIEPKGISLNFFKSNVADGALDPTDLAGVVPVANWNNADRSNGGAHIMGISSVRDSDGNTTGVAFDWPSTGRNVYATGGIDSTISSDHNMLASYYGSIGSFSEEIVISGIPQDFQNQWYDIFVYWGGKTSNWTAGGCLEVGLIETGESYFLTDALSGWSGTHFQASSTSCESAFDGPTYIKFTALDLETVTLKVNSISGQRMGISGIQIVYNNGVPIPAVDVLTSNPYTGLPVAFDASGSVDNGTILDYAWDFGDGETGTGVSATHSYMEPGTYTVSLTTTDDFGLTASTTTSVTVNPQNGGRSISVNFGESIYFISPTDLVGVVDRYNWNNITEDNLSDLMDEAGRSTGASVSSSTSAIYSAGIDPTTAEKRMMKSHIGLIGGTFTVNVDNIPADITSNGYAVYLYLGGGRDGKGGQVTYTIGTESFVVKYDDGGGWDGSHTRSYATTAASALAGNDYVVFENLTAANLVITVDVFSGSRTGVSGLQIVANTTRAQAVPSVLYGNLPLSVDFDASSSSGVGMLNFVWDFGDGATGTGETTSHTFTTPGVFEVLLTATSSSTGVATDKVIIEVFDPTVTPPDLSVIASATSGTPPIFIFFDATVTSGDGPISFTWDFGDGNVATGATAGNTFIANGCYPVQVEARNAGGVDRETIEIHLGQESIDPPVAVFSATPETGRAPLLVVFDASATTGPNIETVFTWDFGDGATGEGLLIQHTYTEIGSYTATLYASNAGGVDSTTTTIDVGEGSSFDADAVSINFGNRLLDTSDLAGVEPRAFWNNSNTTAIVQNLIDSDGVPSTISIQNDAGNKYDTMDTVFTTGDQKMMGSSNGTLAASFTVNIDGIPVSYQSSGYDVIIYFGARDASASYDVEYILDGQARYIRDTNGTWDGTHRESTARSIATAAVGDNYVRWNGLNAASFSILANRVGAQRYGISGMQILKNTSPPPLTLEQKRARIQQDGEKWVITIPSVVGFKYTLRTDTELDARLDSWEPIEASLSGNGDLLEFRVSKTAHPASPGLFFTVVITEE